MMFRQGHHSVTETLTFPRDGYPLRLLCSYIWQPEATADLCAVTDSLCSLPAHKSNAVESEDCLGLSKYPRVGGVEGDGFGEQQ